MGIPRRARGRRPAPHAARGMPGPCARRLPDGGHPRRRVTRADHRRLPRAGTGPHGVRRVHRVHPHPPGSARRGGCGLRRPCAGAAREQAGEDRPSRRPCPGRPAAGRRRRGVQARRVRRRRGARGDPQAQRVPRFSGLRAVAAFARARRLAVEPGAARPARAHRRAGGRGAAGHALRLPRRRYAQGSAHRGDDVPGARARGDAAGAGVLLAGTVRTVRRAGLVRGVDRVHEPVPGQRLRLGVRGVPGGPRPIRPVDAGGSPSVSCRVPRGGPRDSRAARHALADLAARADAGVGVSAEGAGGARVRDPEQARCGEEAPAVHGPMATGVGDSRRRWRGHRHGTRAARAPQGQLVRRQAGPDEAARDIDLEDGLPAGSGSRRGGEDQAVARLGRPAAVFHGRGGAVRACRPPLRVRRGR